MSDRVQEYASHSEAQPNAGAVEASEDVADDGSLR